MPSALLDTGAVVALVNRADRHHIAARDWFRAFRGRMLTTEAVVTETAYVLAASPEHQRAALVWFERVRAAQLLVIEPVADYAEIAAILERYANVRCDYADASLIALANRSGVTAIATIDQRDFSVYRTAARKRFKVLLP